MSDEITPGSPFPEPVFSNKRSAGPKLLVGLLSVAAVIAVTTYTLKLNSKDSGDKVTLNEQSPTPLVELPLDPIVAPPVVTDSPPPAQPSSNNRARSQTDYTAGATKASTPAPPKCRNFSVDVTDFRVTANPSDFNIHINFSFVNNSPFTVGSGTFEVQIIDSLGFEIAKSSGQTLAVKPGSSYKGFKDFKTREPVEVRVTVNAPWAPGQSIPADCAAPFVTGSANRTPVPTPTPFHG